MSQAPEASSLADIVERLAATVVGFATRRSRGSGVLWRDGVVVGSASALWRLSSVSLVLPDGEQVQGTVRGVDAGSDLAAVSFTSGTLPVAGRAAGASPRVDDVVCAVGRDPSGLTHASFGHIGLVAGEWRTWRGGRVDRLIRLDGGLCPGLDGAPVADASGQVLGAKPHMLRHAPISEVGTVPVVEPRGQQPSYDVQGAAAPVRRARRPQVRVRPPRAAAFRQSAVVNLVDATAAMQRKEPVASAGFLVAQFHDSCSRSAAVRLGRQSTHCRHPDLETQRPKAALEFRRSRSFSGARPACRSGAMQQPSPESWSPRRPSPSVPPSTSENPKHPPATPEGRDQRRASESASLGHWG